LYEADDVRVQVVMWRTRPIPCVFALRESLFARLLPLDTDTSLPSPSQGSFSRCHVDVAIAADDDTGLLVLATSGQSNLTKGRIAAAYGQYSLYFTIGRPFPSKLPIPIGDLDSI